MVSKVKNSFFLLKIGMSICFMQHISLLKAQSKINYNDINRACKVAILNNLREVKDSIYLINYFSHDILKMNRLETKGFHDDFIFYTLKIDPLKVIKEKSDTHLIYINYFEEFKNDSFIVCFARGQNRIYFLNGFRENETKELTVEIRRYYEKYYYSFRRVKFKEFVNDFIIVGFDMSLLKKYW